MKKFDRKICIVGIGGSGRDTLCILNDYFAKENKKINGRVYFMVEDHYYKEKKIMDIPVIPRSQFDFMKYEVVIAVGDSISRRKIAESLPPKTRYTSIIHPTVVISNWVDIGEGAIISAGVVLTCNIKIGKHAQLNIGTTITHDCRMGDFFTTAPAVNISGNCTIGNNVSFGTNAATKQGINICDNVIIGMGGIVLKDIKEEGVYFGNPAKKFIHS